MPTILDGVGFLYLVGLLFFPVVWFIAYFIWEVIKLGTGSRYSITNVYTDEEILEAPKAA